MSVEGKVEESPAGPPKIKRNASRKNKKSWRKNVDMAEVEKYMEEKGFDDRMGGDVAEKTDSELFVVDSAPPAEAEKKISKRKQRKEIQPLKCFSLLNGLPGAADPVGQRDRVRTKEERMNPIVKEKLAKLEKAGFVSQKKRKAALNRERYLAQKKATADDRKTRRRTKFDFDLWNESDKITVTGNEKPEDQILTNEWIEPDTRLHNKIGSSKYLLSENKKRKVKGVSTNLPAVEVPHPGASYNPNLADHQDLMWKAALVEINKEKEEARILRATTTVLAPGEQKPNEQTYLQEMAEGIPELARVGDRTTGDDNEESEAEEDTENEGSGIKQSQFKPKTEKQVKKKSKKLIAAQKAKSMSNLKKKESDVFRIRSINKEIKAMEADYEAKQKRRAAEKEAKLSQPIQMSNHKYEEPELEVQLPEELPGNLRRIKAEGSVLEDRFKSLQRRNIVETRVRQKTVRKLKLKRVEKRSYKMGWEENPNKVAKRARQAANARKANKKRAKAT